MTLYPNKRKFQLEIVLRRIFSIALTKAFFKESFLQKRFVIITKVALSSDFKNATVLFSLLSNYISDIDYVKSILTSLKPLFKKEISKKIILKFIPRIVFRYDNLFNKNQKLLKAMNHPRFLQDLKK